MAKEKITRIKANDSKSVKEDKDMDAEISRKVTVKAKNSENKKVKSEKAKAAKAAKKSEKKAAKANKPKSKLVRFLLFITAPFRAIGRYFRDSFREVRQVRWPNRKTTWKLTISVIVYVVAIAVAIMLLDALLTYLFNVLLGGNN